MPLAAALNAFKGEANTLNRRRGWDDSLDPALFTNNVDRDDARRHAGGGRRVAARLRPLPPGQGRAARPPPDGAARGGTCSRRSATAPAGSRGPRPSTAVADAFATYSPRAGRAGRPGRRRGLARRRAARRQGRRRLLHAGPGRREPGAAQLRRHRSTACRRWPTSSATPTTTRTSGDRTPLQRQTPMALAETASIFCETIMVQAGLAGRRRRPAARLAILDGDLQGATPGRRRHPLPVPVRAGASAPSASAACCRSTGCAS